MQLKYAEVTEGIIGAFCEVYNELGHGFLESVYREAMIIALRAHGFSVEREKTVTVRFRNKEIGFFRADLVVNSVVIVELKCARALDSNHEAQLLNYLRATEFQVGLLLNFGNRPHFRRMILEDARQSQRHNANLLRTTGSGKSESDPRFPPSSAVE